jgi:flagellar biosynthesis/type III secretory pathway M-ring protein FliF/YscJ
MKDWLLAQEQARHARTVWAIEHDVWLWAMVIGFGALALFIVWNLVADAVTRRRRAKAKQAEQVKRAEAARRWWRMLGKP